MARTAYNQPRAKRSANRKAVAAKRTFTAPRRSAYTNLPVNMGTNPQRMLVHRGVGLPDRFRTKLQFSESIALSGFGTTITQFYGVRMNGPYDPVLAIGGGQPTFFDMFAGLYDRYNVVGAKITATFALPTTAAAGDGPYMIGITGTRSPTIPTTDAPTLATCPSTSSTVIMTSGDIKKLTATYSEKLLSVDGSSGNDETASVINSTPNAGYNAHIWASPQGTSTAGSVNVVFVIEYIVDFYQLRSIVDL